MREGDPEAPPEGRYCCCGQDGIQKENQGNTFISIHNGGMWDGGKAKYAGKKKTREEKVRHSFSYRG